MSTELLCLVWSTALGFAYISGQVIVLYAERGIRSYDSRRDRVFTPGPWSFASPSCMAGGQPS
jgi:hypothetical protein